MVTIVEKVRYYETDMMGIAHHSNHIRWFECARCEYLRTAGVDLIQLQKDGIIYPIKSVSGEYIHPVYFGDVLCITATLTHLTKAQMVFSYRILRQADGILLATGTSQNVFADAHTGKPIRLDAENFAKLQRLWKEESR